MTDDLPYVPLRWWEMLMVRALARSPRINRVLIEQIVPWDDDEDTEDDEPVDLVTQLEALYQGPSAEDEVRG